MPKKHDEKIESVPNSRKGGSFLHLLVGASMLFFGGWLLWTGIQRITDDMQVLVAPNGRINVEVADEDNERYRGLSGRNGINGGMLFIYQQSSTEHCLVMRDMTFAIDMIWLNEDKKVISINQNVAPETYPEVFCPSSPARYALELPANKSEELGITSGTRLVF